MSFDWMSFATGFLERTEEIQETRREEAQTFEREQRAAAQRNATTISRRRAIADQVTGYANYLTSNGVSNEQLQAVIASGPQAIEQLTSRVQSAVQANGGRPLGSSDVDTLISMPEGFTPLDMTTQEFIDQTYGLAVTPTTTEEREFSLMDRIGGRDQMARAEGRLRQTPFMEGMTIEQINQAAMQGDYQSLIPGTFASIVGQRGAYNSEASTEFGGDLERRLNALEGSDRWDLTGNDPVARQELLVNTMDALIRQRMAEFGDSFIQVEEQYLRTVMGDDYVNSLIEETTTPEPEPEPEPAPEPAPSGTTEVPTVEPVALTTPVEAPVVTEVEAPADDSALPEPPADATEADPEQAAVYQALSEQGVDDVSIALLNSHGSDMLNYVVEQGATTNEELFMALTEWGQQNNIVMPFDKTALIVALKSVIDQ